MLSGLIRILSKIKWWVTKPQSIRQTCRGFCPTCGYYVFCVQDSNDEDSDWYDNWLKAYYE